MFRHLAEAASVPVVAHLDHGYSADDCRAAIDCGFTSVMFDGSQLPLAENIAQTRAIAQMAHGAGVSLEGEIGFVGYAAGAASHGTDPDEARRFAQETGVDAMAISIGNVHLQEAQGAAINMDLLRAIEAVTDVPLVLHGSSGIPDATRRALALTTKVCKFNVGTELRQVFGSALRQELAQNPDEFDRIALLSALEAPLTDAARRVIRNIYL
jgi:fructose-bisphosphate aldolase class II